MIGVGAAARPENGSMLPYGRQTIDEDDVRAVQTAVRDEWLTTGPRVAEFEGALARRCGARFAVAVSSGTAGLHVAYAAAGIGPGDEVVTTPLTFAATASAALYVGARPVFADVDPRTSNLDPERAAAAVTSRTRAVVPVDFAGLPADLAPLREVARRAGALLIEDAAHSLGGAQGGRPVGALADMTVLSFHPVKAITTGEGGAVLTDDEELHRKLLEARSHGIVRERERLERPDEGPWYYEVQSLGWNYRLTDLQCALGLSQLKRLDRFLERRRTLAAAYLDAFAGDPRLELPAAGRPGEHAWHLFVLRLRDASKRRAAFEGLRARGLGVQVHYVPVSAHPLYRRLGHRPEDTPVALDLYRRSITLPLHPSMSDRERDTVIEAVRSVVEELA